jgi:ethanolamine utilization microcompartment shell protein EutL
MYGFLFGRTKKRVLGIVEASADEIAKAKFTAAMASQNKCCSICSNASMYDGAGHGGYLF